MSCQAFEEMLSAYTDGQLSPEDKQALEQHLSTCDSCRSALNEIRAVKSALQALPQEELPPGLHARIMTNLAPANKGFFGALSERLSHWTYRQWVPTVAAAMVLVVFLSAGGGIWYANRAGREAASTLPKSQAQTKAPDAAMAPRTTAPSTGAYGTGGGGGPTVAPQGKVADAGTSGVKGLMAAESVSPTNDQVLLDSDRKIIRRAQMNVEVSRGRVREAADQAINTVKANFGYVESSSIAQSDQKDKQLTSFYMVARVPQENLDKAMEAMTTLGKTTRQDTSAQDITDQYVDLDARLRNKENEEQRLLTIMGQAKSVGELLQVEGELTRVRGDIESMKGQILRYDKQVAMSTLSLTLNEEGAIKPPSPSPWHDVWQAFLNAWRSLLLVTAKAAPTVIVLGVILGAGAFALKRRHST